MKSFHVHIAVEDLPSSIRFYSQLFGMPPSKNQADYAKWMLVEPRVNLAISARGHGAGVNHLGFQADSSEELAELKIRAEAASDGAALDQGEAACCYAKSEKHWTMDPLGLAWEHFLTMPDALTFGEDVATRDGACCIPMKDSTEAEPQSSEACCIPNDPAIYRDTLIAVDFEGMSMGTVAKSRGLSISAIKSRSSRGRRLLKAKLLECCQVETARSGAILDYHRRTRTCCNTNCS